ncbi:MAG: glycosyltransferase family 2 protein, partial [Fimbriimonadales bacterium]|nr:glycosyltransferase family 2 protein [Fimbriimonadales bacterium]
MPFPLHQARTVLDIHAADGITTQILQYYMPYSTVFGLSEVNNPLRVANCGQRYLAALPGSFPCDCVIGFADENQALEPLLDAVESVSARWLLVIAPCKDMQSVDWQARGYQVHYEVTEEPEDGILAVAIRDRELSPARLEAPRVLIISPVRQKPTILHHFLDGLQRLDTAGLEVEYFFIDNNDTVEASQMLRSFADAVSVPVRRLRVPTAEPYHRTETHHQWTESLVWRLAAIKDGALQATREHGYDFAFLVDSDLVLHPQTLKHMITCRRDIVSQVFWTAWLPQQAPLPNVWCADFYNLYRAHRGQELNAEERRQRTEAFLSALAFHPGLYRVGGLGACTLISRQAIEAGVSFGEVRSCLHSGEDRHFCLRAESLGFHLFADSTLPPLHLYRESELTRVHAYWEMVETGLVGVELN